MNEHRISIFLFEEVLNFAYSGGKTGSLLSVTMYHHFDGANI